jgi:hypothetical protein
LSQGPITRIARKTAAVVAQPGEVACGGAGTVDQIGHAVVADRALREDAPSPCRPDLDRSQMASGDSGFAEVVCSSARWRQRRCQRRVLDADGLALKPKPALVDVVGHRDNAAVNQVDPHAVGLKMHDVVAHDGVITVLQHDRRVGGRKGLGQALVAAHSDGVVLDDRAAAERPDAHATFGDDGEVADDGAGAENGDTVAGSADRQVFQRDLAVRVGKQIKNNATNEILSRKNGNMNMKKFTGRIR